MDVLLDVNIVIDLCAPRLQWHAEARSVLNRCAENSGRVWLYAGSVQTLLYSLFKEIKLARPNLTAKVAMRLARQELAEFAADKQWLAALAGEGNVFDSEDPEDEQLVRALDRIAPGKMILITRDNLLIDRKDPRLLTPEQFLSRLPEAKSIDFIDLKTQQNSILPALENSIHRVLHHGQYIMGPEVRELEEKLEAYTGAKYCITVASGTEALLIALMAIDVKPGDEVITTPFTFVATAEAIALVGATPVFVDVEPDTCNIDARQIEAAITSKTKAIIPVSLYGQVADMDEINAIAARHGNIPVIEDAAQSFGATYKGRKSGNLSTIGCTSFFPSKPLGCYGDGGAIFTNDDSLAKAMREIRVHGQERRYYHTRIGVGGRMDTLQCAVVLAKLDRFDWEIERRILAGERYNTLLNDMPAVKQLAVRPDRTCVWGQFTIQVENRETVLKKLNAAGIPTAVHYPVPLHRQPVYQGLCRISSNLENAEAVAARVFSLPMHPYIDFDTQKSILNAVAMAVA